VQVRRGQHNPMTRLQAVSITVEGARLVSGLLQVPDEARVCYVLAHGAGAGMSHPFMAAVANGLAQRGIATLRYQFPYMERVQSGRTRPNLPRPRSARQSQKEPGWFQSSP
jgi:predicted alpha/beta-hydrolase family hydrolase